MNLFAVTYLFLSSVVLCVICLHCTALLPIPSHHIPSHHILFYFNRGNYDNFKEQEATKRKQQQKAWEKQEKRLKELKSKGVTKENAEKTQLKSKSREPGMYLF